MLKSLDIDLLSIVEHHVTMEETDKMATTVKTAIHSLFQDMVSCLSTVLYHQEELDGITRKPSMSNHGTHQPYLKTCWNLPAKGARLG